MSSFSPKKEKKKRRHFVRARIEASQIGFKGHCLELCYSSFDNLASLQSYQKRRVVPLPVKNVS